MAWRVLTTPDALWAQLLKGLYFPRKDFIEATRSNRSSWIWSGIMEGKRALMQGLRKNIGDGQGTSITDAWIPEAYPGFVGQFTNTPSAVPVADFILNPQRIWNITKFRAVFPEHVVKQILLIPLGPVGFFDRLVWHFESSGNFTVQSCYKLLQNNRSAGIQPLDSSLRKLWKWLWQLDLPPKIKFFIWRACRNALPTRLGLHRRRCEISSLCVTCSTADESVEHILFHCPTSLSFWQQVMPSVVCPAHHQSTRDWFASLASFISPAVATDIGFTVWYLWKLRNEMLFQNQPPNLTALAIRRSHEIEQWKVIAHLHRSATTGSSSSNHLITSLAPTTTSQWIVCDGAYLATIRKGAYGVIMYDAEGCLINGRASSFPCAAPICAEASAIQTAIQLAQSSSSPTIIYSDCNVLTSAIHEPQNTWPWIVAGPLATITRSLFWNQQVTVQYAPRLVVNLAHQIAHKARDDILPPNWFSCL
ncbi:Putative ribonuclease H protein At1g65750 [Linum perenne]